jgi:hypothetical protein
LHHALDRAAFLWISIPGTQEESDNKKENTLKKAAISGRTSWIANFTALPTTLTMESFFGFVS